MSARELTVSADEAGARLDSLLAARLPELSRSGASALIREGLVTADGKPAKPAHRVREGESLSVEMPPPLPRAVNPEHLHLDVVFRDEDIAVVDKPAGLVVHPAPGHWSGTLANAVLAAFPSAGKAGSADRPGIVHRLDKDTSGLIAIALSPAGMKSLHRQIAAREARRQYLALVRGELRPSEGVIDAPIGRDSADRKRMSPFGVAARPARTRYRALERFPDSSLIEATLETGRTHQIRVHLAAIGHPVAGDATYGGPGLPGLMRHFLHAYRLRLRVPSTGEFVELEAPLPPELDDVLKRLRGNSATPVDPFPPHGEAP
jgi:23S rRNA pseudouridine1911/1915/1917 synthase